MLRLTHPKPQDVMVIRKINPSITTLSVPFYRAGLIGIGGRATLVRLENGKLAVFSPVALTEDVKQTIKSMGELKYIAALDYEHHIHIGEWYKAYPGATVIGVEGLPEKRAKSKVESVPFSVVFTQANRKTQKVDEHFDREFNYEYMHCHVNKELVMLHKPTKTLIQADLLFNLPATEQFRKVSANNGILTKIFNFINSTTGTALAQKRFHWYAISLGHRPDWSECLKAIQKWDFDTIIPCHGDVIETNGKAVFERVFEWFLDGSKLGKSV